MHIYRSIDFAIEIDDTSHCDSHAVDIESVSEIEPLVTTYDLWSKEWKIDTFASCVVWFLRRLNVKLAPLLLREVRPSKPVSAIWLWTRSAKQNRLNPMVIVALN